MTAPMLLQSLNAQGVTVSLDGDALKCRARLGVLTPETTAFIKEHRAALLAHLRQPPEIVCDFPPADSFPPSEGDAITTEVNGYPQQGRVLTVWDDGTLLAHLDGWPVESYLYPTQYTYTGRRTTRPQEETQ